ncbi:MAG: hypothetical protein IJY18_02425 [Clostridia bacterium]|nr:hypothetical protein [Clostridia bacterium]
MTVSIVGSDPRLRYCKESLLLRLPRWAPDITLLPIPSSQNGRTVKGTELTLDEVLGGLSGGDILVSYGLSKERRLSLQPRGITVIDPSCDEGFLSDNARLTAMGTVGRILTEEISSPKGLKIGIIGYGRIGQDLSHMLAFLGAKLRIFTSKKEIARDMCMLGISGVDSLSLENAEERFSGLDILINTAPAMLVPKSSAPELKGVRVIELASGNNFPEGITYERLASVPAEMYPKSAGVALADAVMRMMGESR